MSNSQDIHKYRDIIKKYKKKLLDLPNVHGISIGKEKVNGIETGEIAIVAHVYKKVDRSKLKDNELFDKVIAGIDDTVVTDVQEKTLPKEEY